MLERSIFMFLEKIMCDQRVNWMVLVLGLLTFSCCADKTFTPDECMGPSVEEIYPEIEGCWQWVRTDYWNLHEFGDTYAGSDTADYLFELVFEGNNLELYNEGALTVEMIAGDLTYAASSNPYPYFDQGYLDGVIFDINCGEDTKGIVYKPDSILAYWPVQSTSSIVSHYNYFTRCTE